MEINMFKGFDKQELSMIEVAHAILEQREDVMDFSDLVNEIQNYLQKSDSDIRDSLAQFYTDLNIDGSFISLGDNQWGLRSWYPIDSIDEEVSHGLDEEETPRRKKRKKVNAFIMDADDDIIDYNDDDPEDAELSDEDEEVLYDEEDEEDEDEEIKAYDSDLKEIGADEGEEEDISNIEEDLTIIEDDSLEEEEYEEESLFEE